MQVRSIKARKLLLGLGLLYLLFRGTRGPAR
jgi:hypothetical protein